MLAEQNHGAHSAQVKMRLIVGKSVIRITHMGPDFLLVADVSGDVPPCEASISLMVDESESQWKVRLPEGISEDSNRAALALPV